MEDNKITYFAETDARNKKAPFGIKRRDRSRHMYVIGKTGMGKSTLLENMAIQDIQNGEGVAFIDPHGKTAELLLEYVPKERINDVLYFAPFDMEHPISFNVMEDVGLDKRHLVVNGLMSTFEKIWVDAWSARMAYILNNTLLALLEYPGSTLLGVNRMLADKEFRKKVVDNVTDPSVKSFWIDEFGKYTERFAAEATPAIQNKVGQFTSNPLVRNLIGQSKSTFDIRKIMDEKKILIINLSKGRVGEGNANLIGSMLITKIYLAAMSRADASEKELHNLPNFYLYVDEFQSFANKSFADILSEARKYKLNLTIAHQYIEQMEEEVRDAVFGNVGSMVTFRVGAFDAEVLEKEFAPQFTAEDLVNLGIFQIYLKLMIDGVGSQPFSATTMAPIKKPDISYKEEIIDTSRKNFARPRAQVEEEIRVWHLPTQMSEGRDSKRTNEGSSFPRRDRPSFTGPKAEPRQEVKRDSSARASSEHFNREQSKEQINQTSSPRVAERSFTPRPIPPVVASKPNPFAGIKISDKPNIPTPDAIPLSALKKEIPKKTDKNPSKENIASLREALASVVKKDNFVQEKPKTNSVSAPESEDRRKTDHHQTYSREEKNTKQENEHPKKPKEIPKDVLLKMLDVSDK
ncbi:MAG: type IV secretion system DNA-binding domain-containing protein [Parcubacteria group bacterium]|nr:type IV secretion system DNA-binding domain-containing protein [Parcubacteria group bacterium]